MFLRTLLGVKKTRYHGYGESEKNNVNVYLVFEQSYPCVVVSLERMKKLLGSEIIESKFSQYKAYREKYYSGDMHALVCHKCL